MPPTLLYGPSRGVAGLGAEFGDWRRVVLATTAETRDAITTGILGRIQRRVRGVEQLVGGGELLTGKRGVAHADRDAVSFAAAGLHAGAQSFGHGGRGVHAGARQDH